MSVVVSTVESVTTLAREVLAVAEDSLALTAGGIPARSYIAPDPVIMDCCPFLWVSVPRIGEETTSPFSPPAATGHRTQFGRVNLVSFNVVAVRCAPESDNADDIEYVTDLVLQDGWSLWCGFYDAIRDGRFKDECQNTHFDSGTAVREQGMCVGWLFRFRTELNGIPQA